MFICALLPLLNPGTYALLPHLFPTGSYSTSVNWVIKYFYIHAGVSWDSHINTVITGLTFCYEGQACCTDFSLPLKYFITSKWKIVPPIQTYLQVIQKGFPMQNLQYKQGNFVLIYLFFSNRHVKIDLFLFLYNSEKQRCDSPSEMDEIILQVFWISPLWFNRTKGKNVKKKIKKKCQCKMLWL